MNGVNKKIIGVGLATILLVGCANKEEEVDNGLSEETVDGLGEDGKVYSISERVDNQENVPLFVGEELDLGKEKIKLTEAEVIGNLKDTPLHIKSVTEHNRDESEEDNRNFLKVGVEYSLGEGVEGSQVVNSLLNIRLGEEVEEEDSGVGSEEEKDTTKGLVGVGIGDLEGEVEAKEEDIVIKEGTDFTGYLVYDLGEGEGNNLYAQLNTLTYEDVIEFPITDESGEVVKRDVEKHGKILNK